MGPGHGSVASAGFAATNAAIPESGLLERLSIMTFDRAKDTISSLGPEERIGLSLALATIWNQKREPGVMRSYVNYAFDEARTNGLKRQEGEIWFYRAQVARNGNDLEGSVVLVDKAIQTFAEQGNLSLQKQSLSFKANTLHIYGKFKDAIRIYEELRNLADTSGDVFLKVDSMYRIALLQQQMGETSVSTESLQGTLRAAEEANYSLGIANCLKVLGISSANAGESKTALNYFTKAAELYQKAGDLIGYGNCFFNSGFVWRKTEDHERAIACFREALLNFSSAGGLSGVGIAQKELGRSYFLQKKYPEADVCFTLAEDALNRAQAKGDLAELETFWGDLCVAQGRKKDAVRRFETSSALYKEVGLPDKAYIQTLNILKIQPITRKKE